MTLDNLGSPAPTERMPVLFVGHGNPMNAILDNNFHRTWTEIGALLPKPSAILSVSAHWITPEVTMVTAMDTPPTIHDFGGFPDELFAMQYPAPGSPEFAAETQRAIEMPPVTLDYNWGLDHGTWSVLAAMFPRADVPVFQLSIDYEQPGDFHYDIGKQLRRLRDRGVLILGSGNIVHNLRRIKWDGGEPYDWAVEFDARMAESIRSGDHRVAIDFQNLGQLATMAHPTYDHFLPLLYSLGAVDGRDSVEFFCEGIDMGSVSMRTALFRPR